MYKKDSWWRNSNAYYIIIMLYNLTSYYIAYSIILAKEGKAG